MSHTPYDGQTVPACKKCLYARRFWAGAPRRVQWELGYCTHPASNMEKPDKFDGAASGKLRAVRVNRSCGQMRHKGECGIEGRLFQPKRGLLAKMLERG